MTSFLTQLLTDMGTALLYGVIGLVLLGLAYEMVDIITPGSLGEHLAARKGSNMAIITSSALLSSGIIVAAAILTSSGSLGSALARSFGFGFTGIVLLGVAYFLIDLVTPGKLSDLVCTEEYHPLSWLIAAALLAVGIVLAAAIS